MFFFRIYRSEMDDNAALTKGELRQKCLHCGEGVVSSCHLYEGLLCIFLFVNRVHMKSSEIQFRSRCCKLTAYMCLPLVEAVTGALADGGETITQWR